MESGGGRTDGGERGAAFARAAPARWAQVAYETRRRAAGGRGHSGFGAAFSSTSTTVSPSATISIASTWTGS